MTDLMAVVGGNEIVIALKTGGVSNALCLFVVSSALLMSLNARFGDMLRED